MLLQLHRAFGERKRVRPRALLGLLGALSFSCLPQGSEAIAPRVASSSTLELGQEGESRPAPFDLVHAGPEGQTTGDPSIQLVFSRPLRALDPKAPVPSGIKITPAVPGHFEWVGVHGLNFVPDAGRLPRATHFKVAVPGQIHALDGTPLPSARSFEFDTPLPQVTRSEPSGSWHTGKPDDSIVLVFSQPVRLNELQPFIRVTANGKEQEIRLNHGKHANVIVVNPASSWPLASTIEYTVLPGYRSEEGQSPATKSYTQKFATYGPLTASVQCFRKDDGSCRPEGGLHLELSNPVNALQLAQAVSATGARLHIDRDWGPNATTRYLTLGAELVPREAFTLRVAPIRDVYGQALKWVKNRQVQVSDRRPDVTIGFHGDSIPLSEKKLALLSTNASYRLVTAPLNASSLKEFSASDREERFAMLENLPGAQVQQIKAGPLNQRHRHFLELDKIVKSGPFALGLEFVQEGEQRRAVRWAQRSDLGVTIKKGRRQSLAWVTDLKTGAPISDAKLFLGTHEQAVGATDPRGVFKLPEGQFVGAAGYDNKVEWLEVRTGDQRSLRASGDLLDPWRIDVETDFYGEVRDAAFIFLERDIFRPGEKAWLKGYLRRPGSAGHLIPRGEKLELALVTPDGEVVSDTTLSTNAYGAISSQIEIPGSAELGYWSVRLHRGKEHLTSSAIQVAEFRPAEFEVEVRAEQPELVAGTAIPWEITGGYFYGGFMKGAKVATTVMRQEAYFSPPGLDDYVTSDVEWQSHEPYRTGSRLLASHEEELNAEGRLTVSTGTRLENQIGPERVELEATVQDITGQTASSRRSVLVHQAAHYSAIKRFESNLLDAPGRVSPQVRTVTPQGKTVKALPVNLSLYRLRWTQVRRRTGDHATETVSELVRDQVAQCNTTSGATDSTCELAFQHSGHYIVRATSLDSQGRAHHSSMSFYAVGGGGAASWRTDDDGGNVELQPDRELYQVGQTARILIKSPFKKARAWVTVEREGVMSESVVELNGPSPTVSLPITESMRPNAYVGVHLLEDRKAAGKQAHKISESYRFGYAKLRVDPESRRLQVNVASQRSDFRPGEEVELNFQVSDHTGKARQAEIAVFVVDEGVLSLSGYQLPDPLSIFTRSRPLRVETIETREYFAQLFGLEPHEDEKKGDEGGGGGEERSAMLTTAYFNPSIVSQKDGKAQVRFKLPDNLGRFRVMALAVTQDDRYGKGEGSLTVNRPLMVRPALPRFLRAGDEFEISASVGVLGNLEGQATISLATKGLTLLDKKSQTIKLAKGENKLVSFRAKANHPGRAEVRWLVKAQQESDAIVLSREVQSPARLETVALYGQTENAEAHSLGSMSEARTDMGSLDVTLSSSALVGLKGGFEQLWDYPYLCTEQLSSQIFPLLLLEEMAALYGVKTPEDAPARIAKNVGLLLSRQRGDGGFGMWSESRSSHPWVSAYALWVLHEANSRGVIVSSNVLKRGTRYLNDIANRRRTDELHTAAFAAFVLSRLGQPDKNTILALYERLEEMPVESQVMLLWAAGASGATEVQKRLLPQVESSITLRGNRAEITAPHAESWARSMGSSVRLSAITLNALLNARPQHALAPALVRGLLDSRDGEGWGSTQEAAFALLALDAYRRAQEKQEPDFEAFVFLKEKLLGKKRFLGRSTQAQVFNVEMSRLISGGDLVFQRKGKGKLFFEARLAYARKKLPEEGLESGFLVEKSYSRHATGHALASGDAVAHGELILVELKVLAPTRRRFVVLDDPLPAGLEAIDLSLNNTQRGLNNVVHTGSEGYAHAWHRSELRDDRALYFIDDMPAGVYRYRYLARATTRGTFVVPPTFAKEMYQEEVYGRTGAGSFTVQ